MIDREGRARRAQGGLTRHIRSLHTTTSMVHRVPTTRNPAGEASKIGGRYYVGWERRTQRQLNTKNPNRSVGPSDGPSEIYFDYAAPPPCGMKDLCGLDYSHRARDSQPLAE